MLHQILGSSIAPRREAGWPGNRGLKPSATLIASLREAGPAGPDGKKPGFGLRSFRNGIGIDAFRMRFQRPATAVSAGGTTTGISND